MRVSRRRPPAPAVSTFPGAFLEFVRLFNEGRYWDSHEALEDRWRATQSDFYQGLIIYASAFVHAGRGNPNGVEAQLEKALRYLEPYPDRYHGIDVGELRREAGRCLELVRGRRRGGEDEPAAGWESLLPTPRLQPDEALIRGDEPELTPPRESSS